MTVTARTKLEQFQLSKLLQCVHEDDREQIIKLAKGGIPELLNYSDETTGENALSVATLSNNDQLVQLLLQLGANPNVVDFQGRTAAMKAAEYGHVETLQVLADSKADMTMQDVDGKGILFFCAATALSRHCKCAEIAIKYAADVSNETKDGQSVVVYVFERADDHPNICHMLLDNGADPNSMDKKTLRTALMAAASSGCKDVVAATLDLGATVNNITSDSSMSAVHEAARGGHLDVLQASCNSKIKNSDGKTARQLARDCGSKEAAKECLRAELSFGKPIRHAEQWALSLYDFCCIKEKQILEAFKRSDTSGHGEISSEEYVEILRGMGAPLPQDDNLKKIINLHEKDKHIDYVVFCTGKKYISKLCLVTSYQKKSKKGKKKGGAGKSKKTKLPMMICTQREGVLNVNGEPSGVFVKQHVHHTDVLRFTANDRPMHIIEDDSQWYLDSSSKPYTRLRQAIQHADLQTIRNIGAQSNFNFNILDKFYKTPLMQACLKGNLEIATYLIDNGANVNATDNFKWTPLHFACHSGMVDVVEYLLNSGANLEAVAMNGSTPLIRAIQTSNEDVVRLLINRGARLRVENRKGASPMDIAEAYATHEVYTLVKNKWDSLPPIKEKKGGGKKTSANKTASSIATSLQKQPGNMTTVESRRAASADLPFKRPGELTNITERHSAGSKSARPTSQQKQHGQAADKTAINEDEDLTYHVHDTWVTQPTTETLIKRLEERRKRYGWQVDFPDYKPPFTNNVMLKCTAVVSEEPKAYA